jgi:hypothetical protein
MIIEGKVKLLELCQRVSSNYLKNFEEKNFKAIIERPETLFYITNTEASDEYFIMRVNSFALDFDVKNFLINLLQYLYNKNLILPICSNIELLNLTIKLVEEKVFRIEEKTLFKIFAAVPPLMYIKN